MIELILSFTASIAIGYLLSRMSAFRWAVLLLPGCSIATIGTFH